MGNKRVSTHQLIVLHYKKDFIMDYTLRQARGLESRLRNLSIDNQIIEVRAYDGAVALIDMQAGVVSLDSEIADKVEINDIRHDIKNMINVMNMECGVSELLNQRDMLYAKRDILNTLGASDDIDRQLDYIKENPKALRIVSVYTESMEEDMLDTLACIDVELNEISRKLNELNNSVVVSIDDEDIEFLKERGVL